MIDPEIQEEFNDAMNGLISDLKPTVASFQSMPGIENWQVYFRILRDIKDDNYRLICSIALITAGANGIMVRHAMEILHETNL